VSTLGAQMSARIIPLIRIRDCGDAPNVRPITTLAAVAQDFLAQGWPPPVKRRAMPAAMYPPSSSLTIRASTLIGGSPMFL